MEHFQTVSLSTTSQFTVIPTAAIHPSRRLAVLCQRFFWIKKRSEGEFATMAHKTRYEVAKL